VHDDRQQPGCRYAQTRTNDVNQQVSKGHRWPKGQSGNPAGRPVGARPRISEQLLAEIASVWEEHGVSVLQRLAITDPGKLAQIAYGLLPRDVFISVEQRTPGQPRPRRVGDPASGD